MKEKRIILIVSISGGAALLVLLAVMGILIGSSSRSAASVAREFEGLLSQGRLAELEVRFYLPESGRNPVIDGEDGTAQIRFVTPAGLAEHFGADAVLTGWESSSEEELLSVIMGYSTLRIKTGMVWGNRTSALLTLAGPDCAAWLETSEGEVSAALLGAGDNLPKVLEESLAEGSVPMRTVSMRLPMQKTGGSWRFAVTEETEDTWFGGLLLMGMAEKEGKR